MYASSTPPESKSQHYRSVLFPEPTDKFLDLLPDPVSLHEFIKDLTINFERHPYALLGEVGIDRSFRLPKSGKQVTYELPDSDDEQPSRSENECCEQDKKRLSPYRVTLDHQKQVLLAQLAVAGKYDRSVSLHGVQAHGVLFEIFNELWSDFHVPTKKERKMNKDEKTQIADTGGNASSATPSFPTRVCLHSYSGPPDQITLWINKRKVPARIYFSFSVLINQRYGEKFKKVVHAVPDDRLLVETDFPLAGEKMQALQAHIVSVVCEIKGWKLDEGVKILKRNWNEFVYGESSAL